MAKKALGKNINVNLSTVSPMEYTWSGGIDSNVLIEVVACRGTMTEQPNGLIIDREDNGNGGAFIQIDATERFMVNLRIDGVNIARLHAHENK